MKYSVAFVNIKPSAELRRWHTHHLLVQSQKSAQSEVAARRQETRDLSIAAKDHLPPIESAEWEISIS